jgi:hypothetical protein
MDNTKALIDCLKPVTSSMFSKAGYCEDFWTLVLVFKSTREIKAYSNVAPEVADECLNAPSIGKWWNEHVKGNPHFGESETIGTDEPEPSPKPAARPVDDGMLTDEELNMIAPDPDAKPQATLQDCVAVTLEQVNPGIQSGMFNPDVIDGQFAEVDEAPPEQALQVLPPSGEILGAWTAPESAAEALDLLAERENEIKAIVKANADTGQQALTVRVTSQESRLAASETLDKLVVKRDKTTAALDPFRKVLYLAYEEAGALVKSAVEPLKKGVDHIKQQCVAWDQQVERQRQEALRKAREEAEAEARRKQQEESERLTLAEVDNRLEQGDTIGAQTLFDAPIEVPRPAPAAVYIPPAAPKVEGQSTATSWKVDRDAVESDPTGAAYLTSITLLLRAVKDGAYPVEQAAPLLSWDFAAADKLAGALQSAFAVPGLSVKPVTTMRVGGKKRK